MARTSPRGRRRGRRFSSTSRCSTITTAVTPRWGTCPRRSTSNQLHLNSLSTFRGELHMDRHFMLPLHTYVLHVEPAEVTLFNKHCEKYEGELVLCSSYWLKVRVPGHAGVLSTSCKATIPLLNSHVHAAHCTESVMAALEAQRSAVQNGRTSAY